MKYRTILLLGWLCLVLTACTPRVQAVQPTQTATVGLDAVHSVGQTFVARYAGLSAILVPLSPGESGDGELVFHLRAHAGAEHDLAQAALPLSEVAQAGQYRFDFPPLSDSNQQYYYAEWEVRGAGSLDVASAPGETYQHGGLYQQGAAQDGQLAFSLEYDPASMWAGLARELVRWAGWFALAGLLFLLPGWALLGGLWRGWGELSGLEKAGLAGGFSLAAYGILLVFTDLLGLHLGAGYAWGAMGCAAASLAWRAITRRRRSRGAVSPGARPTWSLMLADLTAVVLLGLILLTRGWAIRELEAPMWGDSVQHTIITQLILDNGGLFQSWEPYAPYATFGNQFGFPAAAALFAWSSGMDATQAVLWSGQALNVLAVLALYPLAVRLAKGQRWAGVGAILAAGLISHMPAFYFNWGRYAQLAGQVILPVVMWMTWEVLDSASPARARSLPWAKIGLAAAALCGMVMTQYRTPFFYLTYLLACLIGWWLPAWRLDGRRWAQAGLRLGLLAGMSLVLFIPWGARMLAGNIDQVAVNNASPAVLKEQMFTAYQEWRNLFQIVPAGVVWACLAGWVWGVARRQWQVISLGVWVPCLASVYAWSYFGVPGATQVAPFAVVISLYIPAGLVFGWLVGQAAGWAPRRRLAEATLALIVIVTGAWTAWEQRAIAQPHIYTMVTRPDLRAMSWIREHTSPEARFLVEGFRAFYNTSAVGADAGWWLPLLAGRDNSMPPLYALSSEEPAEPGYSRQVIDLVAALETTSLDSPEGVALLCEQGISHIYIGQLQGLVGISWLSQLYTPDELINQPAYQQDYHQDRVYIFALREDACGE